MKYVDAPDLWLGTGTIKDFDDPRMAPVFHFDSEHASYRANTLDAAARLWIAHGSPTLMNVGRVG